MATVHTHIRIDVTPESAWVAPRDWGALRVRLAPGFATDTRLEGEDRIVTFGSGAVLRERLIDCDDEQRRLSWTNRGRAVCPSQWRGDHSPAGGRYDGLRLNR